MTGPSLSFEAFLHQFLEFYRQDALNEALQLIESNLRYFPESASSITAWQSSMLARLGRVDDAVKVLQAADESGFWYHEQALVQDPDFAALQNHPSFAGLVERFKHRRLSDLSNLRPEQKTLYPAGEGPHVLCLVLHGNQSGNAITLPVWQPVVNQDWVLSALQSSQPGWASGNYVWDDLDQLLREIKEHLAGLLADDAVDPQSVVAGGFSMGAHIAIRMALDPDFSLRGVIAHEAWFSDEGMAELEQQVKNTSALKTRIVLISGEDYFATAQQVHHLLSDSGTASLLIRSSNGNHGYPAEFAQLLKQAADWIFE